LLIMIAARNDYFDIWNYPLLLLLSWGMNVVLALSVALLLYQSADRAKQAVLAGLSKQMVQALGLSKDHEIRAEQVQYIIDRDEVCLSGRPALVEFWTGGCARLVAHRHGAHCSGSSGRSGA